MSPSDQDYGNNINKIKLNLFNNREGATESLLEI